jgi:hypothetical protein
VVLVVVIARSQRRERAREQQALALLRSAAEEDVVRFGEDVTLLGDETAGRPLDEGTRQDYRRALDAYDSAKAALDRVQKPDDVRGITGILEDGRYAIACVKARVAGRPLPAKRPPCFFNPAHGPSSQDVDWAPPGGAPRPVPACPADAERVLAGADPYIRTVQMGAQRVPYWEGGPAYAPWAQGYYSHWRGSDLLTGALIGSFLFGGGGGLFDGIGDGVGDLMGGIGDGIGDIGEGMGDIDSGIGDMFGDLFD